MNVGSRMGEGRVQLYINLGSRMGEGRYSFTLMKVVEWGRVQLYMNTNALCFTKKDDKWNAKEWIVQSAKTKTSHLISTLEIYSGNGNNFSNYIWIGNRIEKHKLSKTESFKRLI